MTKSVISSARWQRNTARRRIRYLLRGAGGARHSVRAVASAIRKLRAWSDARYPVAQLRPQLAGDRPALRMVGHSCGGTDSG